jgi:hypothetical protein
MQEEGTHKRQLQHQVLWMWEDWTCGSQLSWRRQAQEEEEKRSICLTSACFSARISLTNTGFGLFLYFLWGLMQVDTLLLGVFRSG